jgi:nucleolar complex protein 2
MDLESFFEKMADKIEGDDGEMEEPDVEADDDSNDVDEEEQDDDDDEDDEDSDTKEQSEDSDMEEDVELAAAKMKEEMERLQKSDPDFHKFLRENEQSLLDFDEQGVDDEDGDADLTPEKKEPDADATVVDYPLLKSLEQGAFKSHGLKSLKKLIAAYKTACHMSDADGDDADKKKGKKYHIDSSAVFDRLMVLTLDRVHEEFTYHLVGKGSVDPEVKAKKDDDMEEDDNDDEIASDEKPQNPKVLARAYRWTEMKPVMQAFFKATLHLINGAKEPDLLTFILKALSKYVPFLTPFPRISQNLLKTLIALWSAPLDSSEDYQVVRLNAFMRIRQLALTQPFPFIEDCLKKTYLAYAKRAKFGTSSSVTSVLPTLTFMGNCVVELYSLDYHSAYQHSFVYIRQLALHLRTAMHKKTPESFQAVYCWQYVHCLKLWVAVLTSACKQGKEEQEVQLLRSLIFPLTEVIFGVAKLIPTTRHLPLRLHLVRFLQQLASTAEMFIPTTSVLLEVLDLKEIGMKPKRVQVRGASANKGVQLPLILKLPKEDALRTAEQLEACVSEVFLLLNREVDLYRYSAGFPEFTVRICQRLRKFSKETVNSRWRAYSKGCVDLCEKNAAFCVKARSALSEAPKDVKRLECLKPHGELSMGERYDKEISRENRLESTSRPASKQPEAEKAVEATKAPPKKKVKKEAKKVEAKTTISKEVAMEIQDEVKEGVDWTDSEGEDE